MRRALVYVGEVTLFIKEFLRALPQFYKSSKQIIDQIIIIGITSLPIVIGTCFFSGAVTAHQAIFQGKDYIPDIYVGMSVIKAFMIELGPILTALVIGGRCGSAITAEIGSMRITEQIDALETLAIDPIRYLVVPRVIAGAIALPLLTIVANTVGCIGGGVCAVFIHDIRPIVYISGLKFHFMSHELWGGLIKAFVFGIIIGLMGSYHGFKATGGTEGVGKATTQSVVSIFVLILISDFIISQIVF
jgi:phospholipid/cholesterol/gamma-HCH transport system permease protein